MVVDLFRAVEVTPGRLDVRLAEPLRSRFLTDDFWATYEPPVDLTALPRSIVLLPAIYNVCAIVWASGDRYRVSGLDRATVSALDALRTELRRLYPQVPWDGEIEPVDLVEPVSPLAASHTAAVLLSTGVDSTYTCLRHRGEHPVLISIRHLTAGSSAADERWSATLATARRVAAAGGTAHTVVGTNARWLANWRSMATIAPGFRSWWSRVQHGMGLSGLAAPIVHHHGADRLYIAATATTGMTTSWGSMPELDALISLGDARVVHDGYEVDRYRKVEAIVGAMPGAEGGIALRVCDHTTDDGRLNCAACEKCYRTMGALVVARADPRRYGFPAFEEPALAGIRREFATFALTPSPLTGYYWQMLAGAAREAGGAGRSPAEASFVEWLSATDFDAYVADHARRPQKPSRPAPQRRRPGWRRALANAVRRPFAGLRRSPGRPERSPDDGRPAP